MKVVSVTLALLALVLGSKEASGFQTRVPVALHKARHVHRPSSLLFAFWNKEKATTVIASPVPEVKDDSWTDFGTANNPLSYAYLTAWVGLVAFAFIFAPGELGSTADSAMLASIFEDPAHPAMNPFYYGIFNLFALIPIVLAATIAPRSSDKGIPAGPPLFLSTFIAYFVMGPYLAFRKTPKDSNTFSTQDLGWFTRNLWENKLLNYATVAFGILCLASGAPGLEDPVASWNGMLELLGTSRFASVSFADLSLITLILTKEVADDYKIRATDDDNAASKATLIGAATALLPILGAAIYCAVRPSFKDRDQA
jgi:hypothetical protein